MPKTQRKDKGYTRIPIPNELIEIIDEIIESGRYGYRSKTEFIVETLRNRLKELGYLK